jgi:hypothetical protein
MRVYLDICCLNRPFDDQDQDRIRLESEAVLLVLGGVEEGRHELVNSAVFEMENSVNRDRERREWVEAALELAVCRVDVHERERDRGRVLASLGFADYDSLHIACAESGHADVLLTTDDRFLRLGRRWSQKLGVSVQNPVEWIGHHEHQADDRG